MAARLGKLLIPSCLMLTCAMMGAASPEQPSAPAPAGSIEAETNGQPNEKEKRRVVTVAVYLVVLVIIVGGLLLVLVVLWGNRLRRAGRRPSPAVRLGDELWYLRPKKRLPSEAPPPAANNEKNGPDDRTDAEQ